MRRFPFSALLSHIAEALWCRPALDEPVDLYSMWIDACEAVNRNPSSSAAAARAGGRPVGVTPKQGGALGARHQEEDDDGDLPEAPGARMAAQRSTASSSHKQKRPASDDDDEEEEEDEDEDEEPEAEESDAGDEDNAPAAKSRSVPAPADGADRGYERPSNSKMQELMRKKAAARNDDDDDE